MTSQAKGLGLHRRRGSVKKRERLARSIKAKGGGENGLLEREKNVEEAEDENGISAG